MTFLADLNHLWRSRGFRLLTWVRVLSQGGDGAFQVGIATAFFFDPTSASTPRDIAAGFAVLLAPFTLVGPFVGPMIDRWHRQRIVLVGNLIRLGLVVGGRRSCRVGPRAVPWLPGPSRSVALRGSGGIRGAE